MEFSLLKKRPSYLRIDVLSALLVCYVYIIFFWEQAFDWEYLLATVMLILTVTLVFVIFLLNFWSVSAHVFFQYQSLNFKERKDIENCTHVRIRLENKKQHTVKRYIVPIKVNMIPTGANGQVTKTYQIELNKKRLLFNADRKTFAPIPFPVNQPIEFY